MNRQEIIKIIDRYCDSKVPTTDELKVLFSNKKELQDDIDSLISDEKEMMKKHFLFKRVKKDKIARIRREIIIRKNCIDRIDEMVSWYSDINSDDQDMIYNLYTALKCI